MSNQQSQDPRPAYHHLNIGAGKSTTATITVLNPTTHLGTSSLATIAPTGLAANATTSSLGVAVAATSNSATNNVVTSNNNCASSSGSSGGVPGGGGIGTGTAVASSTASNTVGNLINNTNSTNSNNNSTPTTSSASNSIATSTNKKKRSIDKVDSSKLFEIIPECQTYHEMFAFERKLDSNISKKTLDIQEALKRPARVRKTLRIFISNLFYTHQDTHAPSWELRIEGRLTEDTRSQKRKFSSFFKNVVIELDSALYGPSDHLIEWNRTLATTESDGFQIRRNGDSTVKCKILFQLEHQPKHYKIDKRLAKIIGRRIDTRPAILLAIWQYIKEKKLQDQSDREYINTDKYLKNVFECKRLRYTELPEKLNCLLSPPEPIVIHHTIVRGVGETQRSIYDIDVELEENPKDSSMGALMMSNSTQQEIQQLEEKICDTLDAIKSIRTDFDLYTSFAKDPHQFTNKWLAKHSGDLNRLSASAFSEQTGASMPQAQAQNNQHLNQHQNNLNNHHQHPVGATNSVLPGDSEEERRADYYYQPWMQEAVCRYFYRRMQEKRGDQLFLSIMDQTPQEFNP